MTADRESLFPSDLAFERSLLRADIKAGNADAATEQLRRVHELTENDPSSEEGDDPGGASE